MAPENLIPKNPLEFIQRCITEQKIFWTYHVNIRMKGRFIPRQFILESVNSYAIIEEYEKDKYFPSYLVYSKYKGKIFHILFAVDVKDDNIRIITTYYPNAEEWEKDLKTRRKLK